VLFLVDRHFEVVHSIDVTAINPSDDALVTVTSGIIKSVIDRSIRDPSDPLAMSKLRSALFRLVFNELMCNGSSSTATHLPVR